MQTEPDKHESIEQHTVSEPEKNSYTMATEFPEFSQLPTEIRLKIIRYATRNAPPECCRTIWPFIDAKGQLSIRRSGVKPPAVYYVNREFRTEAQRQQVVLVGKRINPYCDILQLPRGIHDTVTPLKHVEEIIRQIEMPVRQIAIFVSWWDDYNDLIKAVDLRRLLPDLQVLHIMLIRKKGMAHTVEVWQYQYMAETYIIKLTHSEDTFVPGWSHVQNDSWNPRLEIAVCGRKGKRGRRIFRVDS